MPVEPLPQPEQDDSSLLAAILAARAWLDSHAADDAQFGATRLQLDQLVAAQAARRKARDQALPLLGGIAALSFADGWEEYGEDDEDEDDGEDGDEEDGDDFDEREWLRALRRMHLIQLARERGRDGIPGGDPADDDDYERQMAGLGYTRDPDPDSPSGWIDTPPPEPDFDWVGDMDMIDRLYFAIDELIDSGELKDDFYDAIPDPHLFVLGLLAIVVLQFIPGVDLFFDAYLLYTLGGSLFDLLDALSHLRTASTPEQLRRAKEELGRVIASAGMDALIAVATWGLGKLKGKFAAEPRPPRMPKRIRGLKPLSEGEAMRVNGGGAPRRGTFNPRGPEPQKPFGGRARKLMDYDEIRRRTGGDYLHPEDPRQRGRLTSEEKHNQRTVDVYDPESKFPDGRRPRAKRLLEKDPAKPLPKRLKKDLVLGHPEPQFDPKTGKPIYEEGKLPARDGGLEARTQKKSVNDALEAERRAAKKREKAHVDRLRKPLMKIKRALDEGRIGDARALLRELIDNGLLPESSLQPGLRALLE